MTFDTFEHLLTHICGTKIALNVERREASGDAGTLAAAQLFACRYAIDDSSYDHVICMVVSIITTIVVTLSLLHLCLKLAVGYGNFKVEYPVKIEASFRQHIPPLH